MKIKSIVLLGTLIPTLGFPGELYTWVDDNGVKHFSNSLISSSGMLPKNVKREKEIEHNVEKAEYYQSIRDEEDRRREEERQVRFEKQRLQAIADREEEEAREREQREERVEALLLQSRKEASETRAKLEELQDQNIKSAKRAGRASYKAGLAKQEAREAKQEVHELQRQVKNISKRAYYE